MKHRKSFLPFSLFFCLLLITLNGCNLINPDETIPARIELQPIQLVVGSTQGSAQQKITELWVYADQNFIGAVPPTAAFPYVSDKAQTHFIFKPGIRNNGIASDAIIYPLYTSFEIDINTTPGSVTQVNPVTHYKDDVKVSLNADFETTNEFVDNRDSFPGSVVTRISDNPFEGGYSGEIVLTKDSPFIEVGNAIALSDLPTDGRTTYLEMQYKSEMDMSIGILGISLEGNSFPNFFYLIKPTDHWNMLYIDLTHILEDSGFPAYKILFRAIYTSDSPKPELKIQLDNIKVVHL